MFPSFTALPTINGDRKYQEVDAKADALIRQTFEERIRNYKLNAYRADVIILALEVFLTVGEICVPKIGLSDGIIHHLYIQVYKQKDLI